MGTVVSDVTIRRDAGSVTRLVIRPMDASRTTARRRALLLSTWHPVPVDNGRKQRTVGLIDALRDDYDVILVSLLPEADCDTSGLADVPGVWRRLALPLPVFQPRSYGALAGTLDRWPRSIRATWSARTADALADLTRTTEPAVVIGTDLRTLQYLRYLRHRFSNIVTVLDEPDVSPFVDIDPGSRAVDRLRARLRRRKYERFLCDAARDMDAVLVAAPNEAQAFQTLSGGHVAHVIGNGVQRVPPAWSPPVSTGLLYTGSLTYAPNLEAVTWYARTILPLLRTQLPSAVLHITGALPDVIPDILKQPAFRFTGRLDDLDQIYRACGVFVAPIHSGTGTRVKLLEALAIGMPVVTTSKGCEGIPIVPGEHALVADEPEAFTLAILRVLRDPVFAQTLGARGRAFVEEHARWDASADRFRRIVTDLLTKER